MRRLSVLSKARTGPQLLACRLSRPIASATRPSLCRGISDANRYQRTQRVDNNRRAHIESKRISGLGTSLGHISQQDVVSLFVKHNPPAQRVQPASYVALTAFLAAPAPLVGPVAVKVMSFLPSACFFFLQTSGLKTVKQIKQWGHTGDLNPLQFISLATNCTVWSLYGILRWDMTVLLPNASGALFGLYYSYMFYKYTSQSMTRYFAVGGATVAATATMAVTLPMEQAADYIGYVGCTAAVLLMSSPLAVMSTVIKEKNTSAMPFTTSLATLCNASAWAAYGGLVARDIIILAPNALGLAAAMVQMGLFAKYGIHSADGKSTPQDSTSKSNEPK